MRKNFCLTCITIQRNAKFVNSWVQEGCGKLHRTFSRGSLHNPIFVASRGHHVSTSHTTPFPNLQTQKTNKCCFFVWILNGCFSFTKLHRWAHMPVPQSGSGVADGAMSTQSTVQQWGSPLTSTAHVAVSTKMMMMLMAFAKALQTNLFVKAEKSANKKRRKQIHNKSDKIFNNFVQPDSPCHCSQHFSCSSHSSHNNAMQSGAHVVWTTNVDAKCGTNWWKQPQIYRGQVKGWTNNAFC